MKDEEQYKKMPKEVFLKLELKDMMEAIYDPQYYHKKYTKRHPERWKMIQDYHAGKRRNRLRSTITAEMEAKIKSIYKNRPEGMVVDHIIPLSGCRDCGKSGAHYPNNLQYLSARDNHRKGNRCQECWEKRGYGRTPRIRTAGLGQDALPG